MAYFPLCVDLTGQRVLLIGSGAQIREKKERLAPFGAELLQLDALTAADLALRPAFVVAGDLPAETASGISALCISHGVPVNVVDMPHLCTFSFPSMIVRGDMTLSISTAGKAPGAAACLKRQLARCLPDNLEQILAWLALVRAGLQGRTSAQQRASLMRRITEEAFTRDAVLSRSELLQCLSDAGVPPEIDLLP